MLFGFAPYSDAAYSELPAADRATTGLVVLRLSDKGYTSLSTDSLPSFGFASAVLQPMAGSRVVQRGGRFAGIVQTTFGEIEIMNINGEYDTPFTSFAVDGREFWVKRLTRPVDGSIPSYDDAVVVVNGVMKWVNYDAESVRIVARDKLFKIELPIQSNLYSETGGGGDLTGKPLPLCLGYAWNVGPVYLGVIGGRNVYQVHDGTIEGIPSVRIRGVRQTLAAFPPGAGQYSVNTTEGKFTLGSTPDGTVTCDVEGAKPAGTFLRTTGDIIKYILETRMLLPNADIDYASFSDFNLSSPQYNGSYVGPETTTAVEVIDALVQGVGGYAGFTARGRFVLGVVEPPGTSYVVTIDSSTILQDGGRYKISRQPVAEAVNPNVWLVRLGYQLNYTVQTEIASGALQADREFANNQFREAIASDSQLQDKHINAKELLVSSNMQSASDAQDEATRNLALYGPECFVYRVALKNFWSQYLDIGSQVRLVFPRWNLTTGKVGVIVGYAFDLARDEAEYDILVQ